MAFGVLEPESGAHVPGTVPLIDNTAGPDAVSSRLKHGEGKNSHIVLVPQPTNDPNDPVNWSNTEKNLVIAILGFGAIINGAGLGPTLQAGILPVSISLGVSFTQVTLLVGYVLLVAGSTGIFISAIARKIGKRPVFVFSSTMAVVGCIVAQSAHSYSTLVGGRVVQGLGAAAYETLVVSAVGDMFYVHERGLRVSIMMFIIATVSNMVLLVAGPITAYLGWRYNFYILLPFVTLQLIVLILFVPETSYLRDRKYDIDETLSNTILGSIQTVVHNDAANCEVINDKSQPAPEVDQVEMVPPARKTFWQRMALYDRTFSNDSIFKLILSPIVILSNVAVLYCVLVSGVTLAWFVGSSIMASVIFSVPPYLLSSAGVGYTSAAPCIGGILGTAAVALVADRQMRWMVHRNNGIYEPEFRLPLTLVGMLFAVPGMVGFGFAVRDARSVYVVCVCWGIMMFGLNIIVITTASFVLDAFRQYSIEIFVISGTFKNFFFYGETNYIVDWYLGSGPIPVLGTLAGITAAITLTTIPMYIFGKRYRLFWSNHNIVQKLHLETDDRL